MTTTVVTTPKARRETIPEAATQVFLRSGCRKAPMDGRMFAAGLSRQGLCLHLPGKDVLIDDAVWHFVATASIP
jgi:hypothetical protein